MEVLKKRGKEQSIWKLNIPILQAKVVGPFFEANVPPSADLITYFSGRERETEKETQYAHNCDKKAPLHDGSK